MSASRFLILVVTPKVEIPSYWYIYEVRTYWYWYEYFLVKILPLA